MAIKRTVAIVGINGHVVSALAKSMAKANVRMLLMSIDGDKLKSLKKEVAAHGTEVDCVVCEKEASWEADIIILAVSNDIETAIAEKIKPVATGKVVVSISNPLNSPLIASSNTSTAEGLQRLLPYCKVVKAFNTMSPVDFNSAFIEETNREVFITGDDAQAVKTTVELLQAAGLNPVSAGTLNASRTLERMQFESI